MAVPVLVLQDLVEVVVIIGPQAEGAELTFALIVYVLLLLVALFRLGSCLT